VVDRHLARFQGEQNGSPEIGRDSFRIPEYFRRACTRSLESERSTLRPQWECCAWFDVTLQGRAELLPSGAAEEVVWWQTPPIDVASAR